MYRIRCFLVLPTLFMLGAAFCQKSNTFPSFLEKLNQQPYNVREAIMAEYLRQVQKIPVVENDQVIFMIKSDVESLLLADFNGFLNPRYVKDSVLGFMDRIEGTSWYYKTKEIQSNAIVNYCFSVNGQKVMDPLNPNSRLSFDTPYSFVAMPQYEREPWSVTASDALKGEVIKTEITSKILGHNRTIHVYLPPGHLTMKSLPSVYFHDGSYQVNDMKVPEILDDLIAGKKITPVVAVFDDPVVRGKEYRGDIGYRDYLQHELIPFIQHSYAVSHKRADRAVAGFSRGGMSALYLAHTTDLFFGSGAFSPAIDPTSIADYTNELKTFNNVPHTVFLCGAVYDHLWYDDALALKDYFSAKGISLEYKEISTGHNIAGWQKVMDGMLITFFPYLSTID